MPGVRTPIEDGSGQPTVRSESVTEASSQEDSPTTAAVPDKTKDSKDVEKGGRINEAGDRADVVSVMSTDPSHDDIQYRTMSWQKAACLLFGEYVALAILAFPSAFATLGMAGGILCTVIIGVVNLYTSLKLWEYCMRHPNLINIADIGRQLFGGSWIAYELTALALILNNTFLMGLHTLTGAEIINTLAEPGYLCTVAASIIIMVVSIIGTLPRKLEVVAKMGVVSAISMFIAIVLTMAFSGANGRQPEGYDPAEPVRITAWAPQGTSFVNGMLAALQILFTWVGQIVYPSFIAEMRHPEDFPKALYTLTVAEFALFLIPGIVVYYYAGQYSSAPAVAVLTPTFKKIAFAFVLPTTIIIGIIYGSVVAKYLFVRVFGGTKHFANHTVVGWTGWILIVVATWVFGWVIGEAVPFFGTLISLLSALFDGFFGFIFWAFAYFEGRKGALWRNQPILRRLETMFNVGLVGIGVFVFSVGTYAAVEGIIQDYATGSVSRPFECASNAV